MKKLTDKHNQTPKRLITVEAFRFVHFKRPEIYTGIASRIDFISHPNLEKSSFLKEKGKSRKIKFQPLASLSELRAISPDLYTFMFWLKKHKATLTIKKLEASTKAIKTLTPAVELKLWDNLFYQTQAKSTQTLVEGLIGTLKANHFLEFYRRSIKTSKGKKKQPLSIEELKKAASANVIIPNQLFELNNTTGSNNPLFVDSKSKQILSNQLDIDILQHRIADSKKALEEIGEAEKLYLKKYQHEYDKAFQEYKDKLKEWEDNIEKIVSEMGKATICSEELEPFVFSPKNTWDDEYLRTILSPTSLNIYQSFKTERHTHISETKAVIQKSLTNLFSESMQISKKMNKNVKRLNFHQIQTLLRNLKRKRKN